MEAKEKKPIYKKWWFWLIIVVVVIGVLGATDEDEPSVVEDNQATEQESDEIETTEDNEEIEPEEEPEEELEDETEEPEDMEFGVGESIQLGDNILTVSNVEKSQGDDFDNPSEGKEYVIVTVEIENAGDENISYNPLNFKMQNSNGQIENQAFTIIDTDTSLSSGELAPGGNVSGTIVFEQPIDDPGLILIYEPSFWGNDEIRININ